MMYNNKLSACIKVNGKVLREDGDKVYIPFGSEYTISIKNHNSVRAAVSVDIDSTDATGGHQLIIDANSTIEFTRFIKNGNLKTGNAFKFIERTASIEAHKGIGQSDGLVRISFQFERVLPKPQVIHHDIHHHYDHWYHRNYPYRSYPFGSLLNSSPEPTYGQAQATLTSTAVDPQVKGLTSSVLRSASSNALYNSVANYSATVAEVGITVPGQVKEQEFNVVSGCLTEEQEHVIMLQLFGQSAEGVQVVKPITVKTKLTCSSCGKVNKSSNKYCSECGTGLHLV